MRARLLVLPLPRDSRDTLYVLGVVAWVVCVQSPWLPWWCTALALALLLARAVLLLRMRALPGAVLRAALLVLCVGAVAAQFGTILGRNAGSALVVLLLALKTLEMHARRDAFVVFYLGFFALLSHFFFSQSLLSALGVISGVMALLGALVLAHMPAGRPSLRLALALAARMAVLGTPLMFALFVFFPRMAPLWGLPAQDAAHTGLSADMRPGQIAQLALDDSVALRVRFDATPPPASALYFRGPVLDSFDGTRWSALHEVMPFVRSQAPQPQAIVAHSAPLHYEMLLQAHQMQWLLVLDATAQPPAMPAGWRTRQMPTLQWVAHRPITSVLRYRATSHLLYTAAGTPDRAAAPPQAQRYSGLPLGSNPRTRAMAAQWKADARNAHFSPMQWAHKALDQLHSGGYTYTLEPGPTGAHAADTFWFDSKLGFCEHIANAFVVLMRALDVPARIVTGYQGGQINGVDGLWTVRQSDAHAWAEIWAGPHEGWVRVDPTAAVASWRVGSPTRLSARPGFIGSTVQNFSPSLANSLARSLYGHMRNVWDAANSRWNNWVLNYTQERQFDLLRHMGFGQVHWMLAARLLIAAVLLLALAATLWVLGTRTRSSAWQRIHERAQSALRRAGVRLPESNAAVTARQMAQALLRDAPADASRAVLHAWQHWLLALEAARYAPAAKPSLRALRRQWRALPKLFGKE